MHQHLRGLRDEPVAGAAYYLEEWSVLSLESLRYFIRAHLEYLLDNLDSNRPDEAFVYFFLGQLAQVIEMHDGSPFNPVQTILLRTLVKVVVENAKDQARFTYFGTDIEKAATQFLAAVG